MKGDSLDIVKSCFWKEKTLSLFTVCILVSVTLSSHTDSLEF